MRWLAVAALALLASACIRQVVPDLIVVNARVFTGDAAHPTAEAIAVKGERVIAVGTTEALKTGATGATRVIDAGGR